MINDHLNQRFTKHFLDPLIYQQFLNLSLEQYLQKDTILFKAGYHNEMVIFLEQGLFNINQTIIHPGLIQATIRCQTDCFLRAITDSAYQQLLKEKQLYQKKIIEFLKKVPLFARNLIQCNFEILHCKANQSIVKEGDQPHNLYIIYQGDFTLRKQLKKAFDVVNLSIGEVVGDVEILHSRNYQLSFHCKSVLGVLIVIREDDVKKMVDLQDFHKIIEEKMKFRKERIDKSINMQCPKAVPEPMKDISNRLNTAQAKLRAPLPILIDEAVKQKVLIKLGQNRKRTYSNYI